ncbi:hypothetical protein H0H93_005414 [Arthromyces matolae]|nr:hypothetical protein H0H93_005414 [Arthromyces matolae]
MRYAVLVTGPAGAGKSTFSTSFLTHLQASKRTGHLVNLDPAADTESFEYAPAIDIRDLINLEDVMNELGYGPNGGLVYCFEDSAMVNLEIPWINIMSKMDLVTSNPEDPTGGARNGMRARKNIARYLDPDPLLLATSYGSQANPSNPRFHALNQAIVQLIEDHPLVSFLPLDLTNSDSLETVVSHIDYTMQYGEDEEPKEPHDLDEGDFPDSME